MPSSVHIIVSDLTYMRGNAICVAGWSEADRRMVRPLQAAGQHWPAELAAQDRFWPGNIIEFVPSGARNSRGLPHSHEDTIVEGKIRVVNRVDTRELAARLQPSESPAIKALFGHHLQNDHWVEAGRDCPSRSRHLSAGNFGLGCSRRAAD
jgi:hypothetical protein